MSTGKGPLRFRRSGFGPAYRNVTPKWHRPRNPDLDERQLYSRVRALCDYEVKGMNAMTLIWSRAKSKPKDELCKRCEAAAQ